MTRAVILLACLLLLALADTAFGLPPKAKARPKLAGMGVSVPSRTDPTIRYVSVNGAIVWRQGQITSPRLSVGDLVALTGSNFGEGPDSDYAKLLIGNVRALERDLPTFEGGVRLIKQLFFETSKTTDVWKKDIQSWTSSEIVFRMPLTASRGPIVVAIQERIGAVESAGRAGTPHLVSDPITARAEGVTASKFPVSRLGAAIESNAVPIEVDNPGFEEEARAGEAAFWAFDYNLGLLHSSRGLDWRTVLRGKALDPITGEAADPQKLFGAIPIRRGEVPDVAVASHEFDPYPMAMPLKPLLRQPLRSGKTAPTGWVGFVYAQGVSVMSQRQGNWIGYNCASCHAQRIVYEEKPGSLRAKVFPGLPNTHWSMKWNVLGPMKGVKTAAQDKTRLLYAMPEGTSDATLVRDTADGGEWADDAFFSPAAIPVITRHTPVRRALSQTEAVAGFEGSYVHAQEAEGSMGTMGIKSLRQLTSYVSTLDGDDLLLERLAVYRQLKKTKSLSEIDGISEGQFVQTGKDSFPKLVNRLEHGRHVFTRDCQSCHQSNFGTNSDEDMLPFSEVGTYFSPTAYQRKHQSIRTALLRNLHWAEPRGLLHDGHVKSLEDLVAPERCDEKTELYRKYYVLGPSTFHVPKGSPAQEAATRKQNYFVDVPWDDKNLYWDYQGMRAKFGTRELGAPVVLPAAPHPWCAASAADIVDLVLFLVTL